MWVLKITLKGAYSKLIVVEAPLKTNTGEGEVTGTLILIKHTLFQ